MRGAWLTALAHRMLYDETFELIVSPAIADLQFEPPSAHSYAGVWVALAGAVWRDVGGDVKTLCSDAATLSGLVFMQACYYTCLLTLMSGLTTSGLTAIDALDRVSGGAALMFAFLIAGFSTVPTVVCFWPARR